MGKYAFVGGYTAEAWANMIVNPGDRAAAVRKGLEAVGGKLESFYWSFGDDDYFVIFEAPDDVTAGSVAVAFGSTGTLRHLRTIKLISLEDGRKLLDKAKAVKTAYAPAGSREAAGVR